MPYEGQQAELVSFRGHNGDMAQAYYARPARPGRVPGVVVLHHIIGWDEWTTEVVRKFAHRGYAAIAPNLFFRFGIRTTRFPSHIPQQGHLDQRIPSCF